MVDSLALSLIEVLHEAPPQNPLELSRPELALTRFPPLIYRRWTLKPAPLSIIIIHISCLRNVEISENTSLLLYTGCRNPSRHSFLAPRSNCPWKLKEGCESASQEVFYPLLSATHSFCTQHKGGSEMPLGGTSSREALHPHI